MTTSAAIAVPATTNPDFGFYGAIQSYGHDADAAWATAVNAIVAFYPATHPKIAARRAAVFLDSAGGRHLADELGTRRISPASLRAKLPAFASWMA